MIKKRKKIALALLLFGILGFLHKNNLGEDNISPKENNRNFNDVFQLQKRVVLSQKNNIIIGSVGDCAIDKDGNIWIADKLEHNLKKYNHDGDLLHIIGRKGKGPGEFERPWGLCLLEEKAEIYVADPILRRLSIFTTNGDFKKSFKINDGREVAVNSTGDLYIIAAPWLVSEKEGFCIHLYNKDGKHQKSFFPISDFTVKNQMLSDNVSFDIDKENNIYCIQETDYNIHKYSLSGQLLINFSQKNSYYKAPPSEPIEAIYSREAIKKWIDSWTHVVGIEVLNNGLLLINLLQTNPRKFIIDIYNKEGKFIVGGLITDYCLICTDKVDNIYFLQTEETDSGLNYILLKFSLKNI